MTESLEEEKDSKFGKSKSQQDIPKTISKPLIATKTCEVQLDANTIVELVKDCEIYGLTRQERNHLKFHGFIK